MKKDILWAVACVLVFAYIGVLLAWRGQSLDCWVSDLGILQPSDWLGLNFKEVST